MRQETPVAVVGGGVVGAAVLYWLARCGVGALLLEAEDGLALQASGTNSGILHTGFDSTPGELETQLLLRSAELRPAVLEELGIPVLRCGAILEPRDAAEIEAVGALAGTAARNGVDISLSEDGVLEVPGEAVTDPVAYTHALAAAAVAAGASVLTGCPVTRMEPAGDGITVETAGGDAIRGAAAVNAAGLHADGLVALAGRAGLNSAIRPSQACRGLVHVAAIRSTGLSASLGIAEYVCSILEGLGAPLEPDRPLPAGASPAADVPWWQRTARHRLGVAG